MMHDLFEFVTEHILVVMVILISLFTLAYVADTLARIVVVLLMCGFYIMYGVMHHRQEGNFHIRIALEYLFVAAIIGFVVFVSIR